LNTAIAPVLAQNDVHAFWSCPVFLDTNSVRTEVFIMQRHRTPYPADFRRKMIELVHAVRSPEALAKEFEPTAQTIYNWVAQADRDAGKRQDGLTSAEREELTRLKRENRQLKLERDILAKAAAWFARETETLPDKGTTASRRLLRCMTLCRK